MWDNRCTQHHVLNDFDGERVIQRVTVMGDHPEAAAPPRYAPFEDKFSAGSWRDQPLRQFLRGR
jgi:taurine dioxygenase